MNLLITFNHFSPDTINCIMNVTDQEAKEFKKKYLHTDMIFTFCRNVTPGIYVISNNDEDCGMFSWDEFIDLGWDSDGYESEETAIEEIISYSCVDGDSSDQYFKIELKNNSIRLLTSGQGNLRVFNNFSEYDALPDDEDEVWYPDDEYEDDDEENKIKTLEEIYKICPEDYLKYWAEIKEELTKKGINFVEKIDDYCVHNAAALFYEDIPLCVLVNRPYGWRFNYYFKYKDDYMLNFKEFKSNEISPKNFVAKILEIFN